MSTLWEELKRPDVSIYWPALVFSLSFAAFAVFLLQSTFFRDEGAAVKYTTVTPTYPNPPDGAIEVEAGPEVSSNEYKL